MKYFKLYFLFLVLITLFSGCKITDYEKEVMQSKEKSFGDKAIFLAESQFYNAQYQWRARKLIGHWHFYDQYGTYQTYDITDSAYVWINYNELNKDEGFLMFADLTKQDTLAMVFECGGEKLHFSFKNDTLLLVDEDYHSKTPVLKYMATKHEKSKCNASLDFYGSLPVFINLPPVSNAESMISNKSLQSHLYIGKPKGYLKRKYAHNQDIVFINDRPISQNEEITQFINNELDKLDDSERPKLEVYLNADKDTPPAILDSIKTAIHTTYPDLKLYRIVLQAETGKIGKVKL